MAKNKKLIYSILGILFAIFNVLAFAIPTVKLQAFWAAYVFTIVAFIVQIFIWQISFINDKPLKSKFYNFPLTYISIVYLVIQLLAFFIFMAVAQVAVWWPIVICSLILAISVLGLSATEIGKDEVIRVEQKMQQKVTYIKELHLEIETILTHENDSTIKSALKQLAEKTRYSDPMSDDSLADLENNIKTKIKSLQVHKGKEKLALVHEIDQLLLLRNQKCKLLK